MFVRILMIIGVGIVEGKFELVSQYKPQGDQPKAIKEIVERFKNNEKHLTLLGATGTGKDIYRYPMSLKK